MPIGAMVYTLECNTRFFFEKRTEPYEWYVEGASEKKIVCGAKNSWRGQAWLELERSGV